MYQLLKRVFGTKTPFQRICRIYMLLIAVILFADGILHWARIVEFADWQGLHFSEMPIDWKVVTVSFAIMDLVAGMGMWLMAPWGIAVGVLRVLSQFVIYAFFSDSFGEDQYLLTICLIALIVFLVLRYSAEREKKHRVKRGLGLLQKP